MPSLLICKKCFSACDNSRIFSVAEERFSNVYQNNLNDALKIKVKLSVLLSSMTWCMSV